MENGFLSALMNRLREKSRNRVALFPRDFASPAQDLRFRARGFGFLDVASAIVKERKTCPADLIVRPKLDCSLAGLDRFVEATEFHQRHAERVPAVKKVRVELDAMAILFDRSFQFAHGEVAARRVENFINRMLCHVERSETSLTIPAAVGLRNKN